MIIQLLLVLVFRLSLSVLSSMLLVDKSIITVIAIISFLNFIAILNPKE